MWRWSWRVVDIASIQDCVVHDEVPLPDDDTNFLCHTDNIEIRNFPRLV